MKTPTSTTFIAILLVTLAINACTSQPAPPAAPQPPVRRAPTNNDTTTIWNMPYVLQNGQGAFNFEIQQHNTEPNMFRAQLTTAFYLLDIDSQQLTITGYADQSHEHQRAVYPE